MGSNMAEAHPVAFANVVKAKELGAKVREASRIGWSPENPGKITPGQGKHTWSLTSNLSPDGTTGAISAVNALCMRAAGMPAVFAGDANLKLHLKHLHCSHHPNRRIQRLTPAQDHRA